MPNPKSPKKPQAAEISSPPPDEAMRFEFVPLGELVGYAHPANPKDHDDGAIDRSFDRFGFVTPLVLGAIKNHPDVELIAEGHGRVETLAARKQQGRQPPSRIQVREDGEWLVPAYRGVIFESDIHLEAFLVAANNITTMGGWHDKELLGLLQHVAAKDPDLAAVTGFDEDDVRQLMLNVNSGDVSAAGAEAREDEIAEIHERWQAKLGDLWLIPSLKTPGQSHRLVCGDSTDPEVYQRAVALFAPNIMECDPPYGVDYDPSWRAEYDVVRFGVDHNHHTGEVQNDDVVDWSPALKLFTGNVMYVWHAGVFAPEVGVSIKALGFDIRAQIIWKKPHAAMSRGAYHWGHEPMYYCVRKGNKANWNGDRTQSTIWEVANMAAVGKDKDSEDVATGHSTQKPIEVYRRPLLNHTVPGDWAYDCFSGSGTMIAACELTGRLGIGVELDPKYISLSLQRFADMGLAPERAE